MVSSGAPAASASRFPSTASKDGMVPSLGHGDNELLCIIRPLTGGVAVVDIGAIGKEFPSVTKPTCTWIRRVREY